MICLDVNRGFHLSPSVLKVKKPKQNHPQPQLAVSISAVNSYSMNCLLIASFLKQGAKKLEPLSWHKRLAFTGLFSEET